jgi:CIC family chloride channel protein
MVLPLLSPKKDEAPSSEIGRMLLLCALVGVVSGLGAIVFYWMLELAKFFFMDLAAGYHPAGPGGESDVLTDLAAPLGPWFESGQQTPLRRWALLFIPALGGLISGAIVYRFAPEAAGHGTDAAIDSYHHKHGAVRARVPLIKALTSAITIGSGGSAGREGPIAQIGAGFGSTLAAALKLKPSERRVMMAAGMASGIGAIFHAPLAGALFVSEVLYKDMDIEHEVLVPAFISSIVAYSVFAVKFGWSSVFITPDFVFDDPTHLIPYLALAVVVGVGAILYVRVFYGVHDLFARLKVPNYLKPAIGGLLVGVIAMFIPEAIGTGYGVVQDAFAGSVGVGLLLAVALGKIATTAFSIGSGGSGGVFGPAIVIGGALGGVVGGLTPAHFGLDPGACVLVGMAGFFAAAANCPISTIIMVSEMTGNYHMLVPSMLVCIVAYLVARNHTLYKSQLQSRLESPAKMGHMLGAVLRKLDVRSAVGPLGPEGRAASMVLVPEAMPLRAIIERFSDCDQRTFPVVDAEGRMTGVVDAGDLRRVLGEVELADLIVASDLARPPVTLSPEESLLQAVRKMTVAETEELIVVSPTDPDRPLAVLTHNGVVRAYEKALLGVSI